MIIISDVNCIKDGLKRGSPSYLQVLIQIDQSSEKDEDPNIETTSLELFSKTGEHLPRGKYILQSQGDRGTSDSQGIKNDVFFNRLTFLFYFWSEKQLSTIFRY